MKVALVSLPWANARFPSAALGALTAYLRTSEPGWSVDAKHLFVDVAIDLGFATYLYMADHGGGETVASSILYPAMQAPARDAFVDFIRQQDLPKDLDVFYKKESEQLGAGFDQLREKLALAFKQQIETNEWSDYQVVGFSLCLRQLFSTLVFAKWLKERWPHLKIVFGGSLVDGRAGPSLIRHYDFIDYIIQGEGEYPLLELLRGLDRKSSCSCPIQGVLCRQHKQEEIAQIGFSSFREIQNLDGLPYPNYDDYLERVQKAGKFDWILPIEGSRGCWWDRASKTKDPRNTCFFCSINSQWNIFREKSAARLVKEITVLSRRYSNANVRFPDNAFRVNDVAEFAHLIKKQKAQFLFACEMRVQIDPHDLLLLWEAGLDNVQFGIEALSTSILKRLGKGTTTIQNLQVMKTCHELGLSYYSNILTHFPGCTQEEVDETAKVIREYAAPYHPLTPTPFGLRMGCTVEKLWKMYGLSNLRTSDNFKHLLPDDVYRALELTSMSFDSTRESADWTEVLTACKAWKDRFANPSTPPPLILYYRDGGTFLHIYDFRKGNDILVLKDTARDLYLYCMQTRSIDQVLAHYKKDLPEDELQIFIRKLEQKRLVYIEGCKILSLACAERPLVAARRIRSTHALGRRVNRQHLWDTAERQFKV